MRKLIATVFNYSLDGLLADEGTDFWEFCFSLPENREPGDPAQLKFLPRAYAHIMGRTAYEAIAESMTRTATEHPLADILTAGRKVVFSRTLKTADWANTTIADGDTAEEIDKLRQGGDGHIVVWGGVSLWRSLMQLDLPVRAMLSRSRAPEGNRRVAYDHLPTRGLRAQDVPWDDRRIRADRVSARCPQRAHASQRSRPRSSVGEMDRPLVPAPPTPLLRGVLHQGAFFVAVIVAPFLIFSADGERRQLAATVFATSVAACFGASALYHRVSWSPRVRLWMRRVDHAGIYLLIAGTYTPVALLVLRGTWRPTILAIVWAGAAAAIVLKFVWVGAPKWLGTANAIALGWFSVVALPQLVTRLDPVATVLLIVGGLVYTAGAIVYAWRRPDPMPHVFGYHELFHALTIVAITCQYAAIALIVRAG